MVSSQTFCATIHAIHTAGGVPRFVDIDPATQCVTGETVEDAITVNTRAVLPVFYGGRAVDLTELRLADREIAVVEDAATPSALATECLVGAVPLRQEQHRWFLPNLRVMGPWQERVSDDGVVCRVREDLPAPYRPGSNRHVRPWRLLGIAPGWIALVTAWSQDRDVIDSITGCHGTAWRLKPWPQCRLSGPGDAGRIKFTVLPLRWTF